MRLWSSLASLDANKHEIKISGSHAKSCMGGLSCNVLCMRACLHEFGLLKQPATARVCPPRSNQESTPLTPEMKLPAPTPDGKAEAKSALAVQNKSVSFLLTKETTPAPEIVLAI